MTPRTHLLIGLAVLLLGAGVAALAFKEGADRNVYVEEVLADPQRHDAGEWVLMGIPQPALVPVTTEGGVEQVPNAAHANTTATTTAWRHEGSLVYSRHTLTVEAQDGTWTWTFTNTTRALPSDAEPLWPPVTTTWTTTGGRVFPVEAFDDHDGDSPRVWAVHDGVLKAPMQPKPSQFTGRTWTELPDGRPLPPGLVVYAVDPDGYTAGCSSKFLPPEQDEAGSNP